MKRQIKQALQDAERMQSFLRDLPLSEVAELLRLKESVVRSRFAELCARLQANQVAGGEAV